MFGMTENKLPEAVALTSADIVALYDGRLRSIEAMRARVENEIERANVAHSGENPHVAHLEEAARQLRSIDAGKAQLIYLRDRVTPGGTWDLTHNAGMALLEAFAPLTEEQGDKVIARIRSAGQHGHVVSLLDAAAGEQASRKEADPASA